MDEDKAASVSGDARKRGKRIRENFISKLQADTRTRRQAAALKGRDPIKLAAGQLDGPNWDKWRMSSSISAAQCLINSCKQGECVELMRRECRG